MPLHLALEVATRTRRLDANGRCCASGQRDQLAIVVYTGPVCGVSERIKEN